MASSGKDPDEGEAAPSTPAATDEVDSGWGTDAPVEPPKTADAKGESGAAPPGESPPGESPSVESPSVESPSVEPPPPEPLVESPPAEPPRVELPVGEPPPAPPLPAAAVSVEARGEPGPLAAFWSARPNGAWLAVSGGAVVVAFAVGIFTGRGSRSESKPEDTRAAASSSALARPAVVAPASAPPPAESQEAPSASASTSSVAPKLGPAGSAGFNAKAAKLAIDKIVPRLKACKQKGEPPGSATVTVTFAPSGRVSDARVTTTRYSGTRTGNCIAQRLREARIPEFVGSPVTVKRSVAIR